MAGKKTRSSRTAPNHPVSLTNLTSRPTGAAAAAGGGGGGGGGTNGPGAALPAAKRSADDLASLTKQQLQVECRKRGQKTTGTKVELLQRLGHKMTSKRQAGLTNVTSNGSTGEQQQTHHSNKSDSRKATQSQTQKQRDREERESLVLWKRPIKTVEYFARELFILTLTYGKKILMHQKLVLAVVVLAALSFVLSKTSGPHQAYLSDVYIKLIWCAYWTGLGILSSVGLGTGLHTFLLYLGPHIAKVTLAAYECGSLDFPEPPYPDEIVCPESITNPVAVTILSIMSKVRLEAMCWGAGTALGELPPYFMARAARLSGIDPDDEDDDMAEFEELQKKRREDLTLIERGKLFVEQLVQKVGFLGILACASIPNPLFDLAGITCGHFLVPFWTFFGATLIGKAVIKMHIQKLFVIIAFNETLINSALSWLTVIPVVGARLETPFRTFLDGQKTRLHSGGGGGTTTTEGGGGGVLAAIFEKFVFAMILYFVISIVNSFAQSYHKRLSKKRGGKAYKD